MLYYAVSYCSPLFVNGADGNFALPGEGYSLLEIIHVAFLHPVWFQCNG